MKLYYLNWVSIFFPSGLEWKWLWSSSEEAEDHAPGSPTPAQAKEEQSSHQTQPPTEDVETSWKEEVSDEPLYSQHKQGKADQQRAS